MNTPTTAAADALPAQTQPALRGLPRVRKRRPKVTGPTEVADTDPVAQVLVDVPAPSVDRLFDYAVPATLDETAQPGVRVRVPFGPRTVDGIVVARTSHSEPDRELSPLAKVVSPLAIVPPTMVATVRQVADYYAGTAADVVRAALPPRHAAAETAWLSAHRDRPARDETPVAGSAWSEPDDAPGGGKNPWQAVVGGEAFLRRLAEGQAPRAAWCAVPDAEDSHPLWARALVSAALAVARSGRRTIVVLPTGADVNQVASAMVQNQWKELTPEGPVGGVGVDDAPTFVRLQADAPAATRWTAYLDAWAGRATVVVGTRAAVFAPVPRLGLVVCWDDGASALREDRAPRFTARTVLVSRAETESAGALFAGTGRSVEVSALVASGWAKPLSYDRATVRASAPRVVALTDVDLAREAGGSATRVPHRVVEHVRGALQDGPVLVQVPRAGYVPALACQKCRAVARCRICAGPLRLRAGQDQPSCSWCGALAAGWTCPHCGGTRLRAIVLGRERTAEELGRLFPRAAVIQSGIGAVGGVKEVVGSQPRLVVATPGAEPRAQGGYVCGVFLDAATMTSRPELGAEVGALTHWLHAASLVRPAPAGGVVFVIGEGDPGATGALVRWDPAGFAERHLAERSELALPPVTRFAAVTGERSAVDAARRLIQFPEGVVVYEPQPWEEASANSRGSRPRVIQPTLEGSVRMLLRADRGQGRALAAAMKDLRVRLAAERMGNAVAVELDPEDL